MTAELWLPREVRVLVSVEDLPFLRLFTWWEHVSTHTGNSYAYTQVRYRCTDGTVRRRKVYMHRAIAKAPPTLLVDHRNRVTLDNRRSNLRVTNGTFNNVNRDIGDNLCGFRGVSKCGKKFRARIQFEGEEEVIGRFETAEEAARAYDARACELFGEFAFQNFDTPVAPPPRVIERELEEIPF